MAAETVEEVAEMSQQSVRDAWKVLESMVIPAAASEEQRQDMMRCFYAGVIWMMDQNLDLGESDVSEDAGVLRLELIRQELAEFIRPPENSATGPWRRWRR